VLATLCWSAPAAVPKPAATAPPTSHAADVQDIVFLGDDRPVLIRLHLRVGGRPFRHAWERYMHDLFAYLDVNGDGVLSAKEAKHVPNAQQLLQSMQGGFFNPAPGRSAVALLRDLDTNKDGKVTVEELMSYYRHSGAGPFQQAPVQFQLLTSNPVTAALFEHLDRNRDGKLTKTELEAAAGLMATLDYNDDELLSPQEVAPSLAADPFGFVRRQPPGPRDQRPMFVTVDADDGGRQLSDTLRTRYGRRGPRSKEIPALNNLVGESMKLFNVAPRTAVRKVTRQQIGLDRAAFDLLDADHNGELNASELARFCERPADIEVTLDIDDSRPDRAPRHSARPPFAAGVEAVSHGAWLFTFQDAQLHVRRSDANPAYAEFAQAQENAIRQFFLQQFRGADKKGKGYVEYKDLKLNTDQFLRTVFELADRDNDGKLYEREFAAYLDISGRAASAFTLLSIGDLGRGLFEALDANRDGYLGLRELRTAWMRLARWDRNKDGSIGATEVPRQFQFTLAGAQNYPGRFFGAMAPYGSTQPVAVPTKGPLWFRKMDRNGDGDVSPREFLGTREEFRRIDTDGDGLIDAAEAERADRWFRQRAVK
jgi:Ca2+-binding EF-hand superfamily protein